ncbi:hypothetical protein C5F63_06005 [Photobacterium damselae subsp. damselae]|uniref:hypothetical protein n=1 Tax=Photobacterium damselae TaxID=38293 RepID=UPI000D06E14F|nr:hypothetical protein [Photobacterium damselae]PSB89061.1 hypothetical protein C5F63_06005 [Photobacterium damselae subsp. damselae]
MPSIKDKLDVMSHRRELLCASLSKRRVELSKSFMTRGIAEELEPVEKLLVQFSKELDYLGEIIGGNNAN